MQNLFTTTKVVSGKNCPIPLLPIHDPQHYLNPPKKATFIAPMFRVSEKTVIIPVQ